MTNASTKKTILVLSLVAVAALGMALSLGAFVMTVHAQEFDYGAASGDYGFDYGAASGDYGYNAYDYGAASGDYGYNSYDYGAASGDWTGGYGSGYADGTYGSGVADGTYGSGYADGTTHYDANCGCAYVYENGVEYMIDETYEEYVASQNYGGGYGGGFSMPSMPRFSAPSMPPYPSYPSYPSVPSPAPRPVQQPAPVYYPVQQQQQQQQAGQPINIVNNNNNTNNNSNPVTVTVVPVQSQPIEHPVVYAQPAQYIPQPVYQPQYIPQPVISQPSVSLSQIPYTGFDFGPVGNMIYWLSLLSLAAAGAYLLIYYKGGASLLTASTIKRSAQRINPVVAPVAAKIEEVATPALTPIQRFVGTRDRMVFGNGTISVTRE